MEKALEHQRPQHWDHEFGEDGDEFNLLDGEMASKVGVIRAHKPSFVDTNHTNVMKMKIDLVCDRIQTCSAEQYKPNNCDPDTHCSSSRQVTQHSVLTNEHNQRRVYPSNSCTQ